MSTVIQITVPSSSPAPASRPHLNFLDGMRGLAAVWVMLAHLQTLMISPQMEANLMFPWSWLATLGHCGGFAVAIFIALSGFCLMLPIANQTAKGRPPDLTPAWWRSYIYRRARRILPPYYAALALCWLLPVALRLLPGMHQFGSDTAAMNYGPGNMLSHLFLVHNLSPVWWNLLDPPMWSVATEWQIYFLFPLFLIPAWRRAGRLAAVAVGFFVGLLPQMLGFYPVASTTPGSFYLGIFALGMAGADLRFRDTASWERMQARVPWQGCLAALTLILIATMYLINLLPTASALRSYGSVIAHSEVGLITVCLILFCSRVDDGVRPLPTKYFNFSQASLILRCLESRVAVKLGTFSYSLYLIHYPVLDFIVKHLHGKNASPLMKVVVVGPVCIVAAMLASYGFHLLAERRVISAASRPHPTPTLAAVPSSPM
jgi:peptidoglycan/LPS O-acetylase OafA/YrhL